MKGMPGNGSLCSPSENKFSATCVNHLVQSENMASLKTWCRGKQGSRLDRITGCISTRECCIRPSAFCSSPNSFPPCASLECRLPVEGCCPMPACSEGNCWAPDCKDESAVSEAAAAGEAVLEAELTGSLGREYDFSNCVRLSMTSYKRTRNSPDALCQKAT